MHSVGLGAADAEKDEKSESLSPRAAVLKLFSLKTLFTLKIEDF